MFIAGLDTKYENLRTCFAGHSLFVHHRKCAVSASLISNGSPQHGQVLGSSYVSERVRLSSIAGITILALYTVIVSPTPNCRFFI